MTSPPTVHPPPYAWEGELARTAWREGALTRVHELESLSAWLFHHLNGQDLASSEPIVSAVFKHLELARGAARNDRGLGQAVTGSAFERATSNIDAAEADLLRVAPDWYVVGLLPSLLKHVERHLDARDIRLTSLRDVAKTPSRNALSPAERGHVVAAVRAASSEATREQTRVRSFRNVLYATCLVLAFLVVGLVTAGWLSPATIPLCFEPESGDNTVVVCPTEQSEFIPGRTNQPGLADPDIDDVVRSTASRADIATIAGIGLLAASVAGATMLRNIRGTSTPFALPVALAILKLPSGAMTAVLGLLLMRGGFIPGLSALDSSAQILAWAVVFGYAQQLLTRLVDQQAHSVLNAVRGHEPEPRQT